jgi:hypothetical protein
VHICRLQGYWVVVATSCRRVHMYDASTVYIDVSCHRYVSVVIRRCLDLILVEYPLKVVAFGHIPHLLCNPQAWPFGDTLGQDELLVGSV